MDYLENINSRQYVDFNNVIDDNDSILKGTFLFLQFIILTVWLVLFVYIFSSLNTTMAFISGIVVN